MGGIILKNKNDSINFGVMSLPDRKSKALYQSSGNTTEVLAYFTSDENSRERLIEVAYEYVEQDHVLTEEEAA